MKKKGFTLIELLAVVVVLGVVATIIYNWSSTNSRWWFYFKITNIKN